VFDNCYLQGVQFEGKAYFNSNHVIAISGKENTEFDRIPADVNVAMFTYMLLVIGCVTVIAKIVEDEVW